MDVFVILMVVVLVRSFEVVSLVLVIWYGPRVIRWAIRQVKDFKHALNQDD